jgi:8-oxo-dGTP pyrophosphatase MutT (NUDIX family)
VSELSRRTTRYQAAIVRDGRVLLIQHRVHATGIGHWLLPGGGRENGEAEEQCVVREVREETGLEVAVERLLFAAAVPGDRVYDERKTYLCRVIAGEASPGVEPEPEHSAVYAISETRWVDFRDPSSWGDAIVLDGKTYPELLRIREILELC